MKHNWEYKRLGELCDIKRGGSPRPIQQYITDSPDGINWIKIGDAGESKYITSCKEKIIPEGVSKSRFVHKGDFLLSNSMSFGRPYILDVDGCIHDGWLVLEKPKQFITDFLYYVLGSPAIYSEFSRLARGAVVSNLNVDLVSRVKVPVPTIIEQERIVAELDEINKLIAIRKEQLQELDNLAQSLFYDTFGDPITNPKGWNLYPFKDSVIQMHIGPFGSALKTDAYVPEDQGYCMVYEQKHAIKATLEQENHFINEDKYLELKRFEVNPGDFIMSCRGTIGKLFQIPKGAPFGIIHPSLMKIRLDDKRYNSTFFSYFLPSIIEGERTKGNCVQMAITAKELGNKKLPLPPIELQQQFAEQVEAIEAQKAILNESLKELQTLLDSRMDYWFN